MESLQPFPTENDLSEARKTVRDLAIKIEKTNSRAQKHQKQEENQEDSQYTQVMKEIETMKQELGKLKLDMKHVLKEKKHTENGFKASSSKSSMLSSAVERIKKEIEELDEEQVLVEIARIEAVKELEAIEAQKKEEAIRYQIQLEEIKKKTEQIIQQKASNVNMNSTRDLLHKMNAEKEALEAELEEIKREGFNLMASMDVIRNELKAMQEEMSRLEKEEEKRDLTIETLNAKILKGKLKLESVTSTTEKANSIASNLSITVNQLRAESETARKEKEITFEEIEKMKHEIPKTESEIELSDKQLQSVMEELKTVKLSEFKALENLKNLIESTVRARDPSSLNSTTITITSFEYKYLTENAGGAEVVSDKKVAAARAWVEALKANEKEILMKVEMVKREISEIEVMEEDSLVKRRSVDGGVKVLASPRRSMYKMGNMTPGRRRSLKLLSPATRHAIKSASFSKKREKMMTSNLGKFLDDEDADMGD
ncbi:hypothetical protein LXL04_007049 [Taraxacum kok-saghyz]